MAALVVHFVAGLAVTLVFGLLLLGWRDRTGIGLSDQLAAALSIFAGMQFGVFWKLIEFVADWVFSTDFEKSNSETMTQFLWNDVGAVVAAVLATRLYCHVLSAAQRQKLGRAATWLFDGPSRVLDRHGALVTVVVVAVAIGTVAGLWFAGRPMPGLGNG